MLSIQFVKEREIINTFSKSFNNGKGRQYIDLVMPMLQNPESSEVWRPVNPLGTIMSESVMF